MSASDRKHYEALPLALRNRRTLTDHTRPFVRVDDAARRLGIPEPHLLSMAEGGEVPSIVNEHGVRLFYVDEIEAWELGALSTLTPSGSDDTTKGAAPGRPR
jgi:hypothetical protein